MNKTGNGATSWWQRYSSSKAVNIKHKSSLCINMKNQNHCPTQTPKSRVLYNIAASIHKN